jgi:outer membrane protein OmpA-like peptidoglycan-associated protein
MMRLQHYGPNAGPEHQADAAKSARKNHWNAIVLTAMLAGCAPVAAPPVAPPAPVVTPVPFAAAVMNAANTVFAAASTGIPAGGERQVVVIDPLVNGVTGERSVATQQIQERIIALAKDKYPQFDIQPFTAAAVAKRPDVMVGTFTPVNASGQTAGTREGYRFCLVMVNLNAGKTIAKGVSRAQLDGVDSTPVGFFRDSPAWTNDAVVKSYIDTCQATKVGDPINPTYANSIITASLVSEAIDAYDSDRYREALELYQSAQKTPFGNQLRVYNGLYLANWKLGRRGPAEEAFGQVVAYGLQNGSLGVKILFRPGSTALANEPQGANPYDMWLREIAVNSNRGNACLQVTGHSSPTGSPAVNEQLSQLRAEYVKDRLENDEPALRGHVIATGVGSKNNLIGTGADNLSDALDRRVEFKVLSAC